MPESRQKGGKGLERWRKTDRDIWKDRASEAASEGGSGDLFVSETFCVTKRQCATLAAADTRAGVGPGRGTGALGQKQGGPEEEPSRQMARFCCYSKRPAKNTQAGRASSITG